MKKNKKKYKYDYKLIAIHKDTWIKLKKLAIIGEHSIGDLVEQILMNCDIHKLTDGLIGGNKVIKAQGMDDE